MTLLWKDVEFRLLVLGVGVGQTPSEHNQQLLPLCGCDVKVLLSLLDRNYEGESRMGGRFKTPAKEKAAFWLNPAELRKALHAGKAEHLAWELAEKRLSFESDLHERS